MHILPRLATIKKQLTNSKIVIYKPLKPINERMQIFHLRALTKTGT